MFWKKKELNSAEFLELKKDLQALKLDVSSLSLEFDLIVKKLKVKYKISKKDHEPETEEYKNKVLLPE